MKIAHLCRAVLLSGVCLTSCAQSKNLVIKSYAFMSVSRPGTIAVDENGKPLNAGEDTTFIIYVETKKTVSPEWKYAWKNDKFYTLNYSLVEQKSVRAGKNKLSGEEITISATGSNKLWLLQLIPVSEKKPSPKKMASNEMMIQGVYKNSIINKKISELVILFSAPSQ